MGMACSVGPTEHGQCCQVAAQAACRARGTKGCESQCIGASQCEIARLREASLQTSGDDLRTCIPIKSAWFSRQSLALNLAILAGGSLLFCMALPFREALFVPGALSQSHAQILGNRMSAERCSQCHPGAHAVGADGQAITQDQLCLNCHAGHLPDAAMQNPHDLHASMLSSLREQWVRSQSGQSGLSPVSDNLGIGETRCAMCHIEHRGPHHDLQHISDMRCQACHQSQFAGLGEGHPEFDDFPYRRERRLAFDHAAHANRHFAQKSEAFECTACHVDTSQVGSVGVVFRSLGFDQACARCHDGSIRATQSDGWLVFQVPSVEPADVQRTELGLKDWPSTAQFGYDGVITTPVAWLLYADPEVRSALMRLPSDGQLAALNAAEPDDVEAARSVAGGMRRLVRRIANEGQLAVTDAARQAAESLLGRTVSESERTLIECLAAGMPPDLFRQMELRWFGVENHLATGQSTVRPMRLVAEQRLLDDGLLEGEKAADDLSLIDELLLDQQPAREDTQPQLGKLTGVRHVASGGWYLDEELLAVRYMPTGHADPLLTAWTRFGLWMEAALRAQETQLNTPEVLRSHTSRMPPGDCVQCHLLPTRTELAGPTDSAWSSVVQPLDVRPFTKFDHGPHLALPLVRDCRYCHQLTGTTDVLAHGGQPDARASQTTGADFVTKTSINAIWADPAASNAVEAHSAIRQCLQQEFRFMEQEQCTACHRSGGAESRCTQCHNYHVGTTGFEWSRVHH